MPIIGTYSGGSASANRYDTFQELLTQLPDNSANLIVAQDIRDSVYSLWTKIEDVELVASQSASASSYYTNSTPVPVTLGGITAGMSFSGTYSMQQMFDLLLYPYIAPAASLSGGNSREFGSSNALTLSWSVTVNSNPIVSIIVNGVPKVFPPYSGVQAATVTQNVNYTINMTASDGTSNVNSSTSVTWLNKRYWGTASSFGSLANSEILGLNGAGVGSGNELSTTRVQTRNGINGGGDYLAFAWPTSFGTPTFVINGLPNSAWTKVNDNVVFTNVYSYTASYDVWMSNTPQFSPITSFQIS